MSEDKSTGFESYRERLMQSRSELTRRLDAVQRDVSKPLNADSGEQATELENRDVLLALGSEARAELAEIERALERITSGRYGVCTRCGESIAVARLDAYPAAVHCLDCANAR